METQKVLVLLFTPTALDMREIGKLETLMVSESFHSLMGASMREIGAKVNITVKEFTEHHLELNMMVIGKWESITE